LINFSVLKKKTAEKFCENVLTNISLRLTAAKAKLEKKKLSSENTWRN